MRRSRKFIIIALLAVVVLAGTIGGVVYAQTGGENSTQPKVQALLDRALEIYKEKTGVTIDPQVLKDSLAQAQKEARDKALDTYLQGLVDQKKITQEQADKYRAWLDSKPDVPLGPGIMPGRGFARPFGGMRGWCLPQTQSTD